MTLDQVVRVVSAYNERMDGTRNPRAYFVGHMTHEDEMIRVNGAGSYTIVDRRTKAPKRPFHMVPADYASNQYRMVVDGKDI